MTADQLKELARLIQAKAIPTREADLVQFIRSELSNSAHLRAQWDQLDALSQKAVAAAAHNHSQLDQVAFAAQHGSLPSLGGRDSDYRDRPSRAALFFVNGWYLPNDLVPLLKRWVPPPELYQVPTLVELPAELEIEDYATSLEQVETERAAGHDLVAVLRLTASGKIAVSNKTALPTASALKMLAKQLLIGDYYAPADADQTGGGAIRPFGLVMIAQAAGLAKAEGARLRLTRRGEAWLQQPDVTGLRKIFQRWVESQSLNCAGSNRIAFSE